MSFSSHSIESKAKAKEQIKAWKLQPFSISTLEIERYNNSIYNKDI
jgi:hypothetical protein